VRNFLYDKKLLRSVSFGLPVIGIGNLSVGGTGKSPMAEYLAGMLKNKFRIAILSRGYKRKTRGYSLAHERSTALEIGDEPMQFHLKFPEIPIAVGEKRVEAIPQLLHDHPGTEAILLDDAFQHRRIKAGLDILLTDRGNLFTRDFYLPTGDLRDQKRSYRRADMIIVTKCSPSLNEIEKEKITKEITLLSNQSLFFSTIEYEEPYHIRTGQKNQIHEGMEVLLVTGIANPKPLKSWVEEKSKVYYQLSFPDHHVFRIDDLRDIKNRFEQIRAENKIILTTEKDGVRLLKFKDELAELPLFVIPVRHRFLFGEEQRFDELVSGFIKNFKRKD
ncbi:MAG TPA: tetraacyldisaccharide 4'-kinase, partial [Chitinophagaceae bacterium]|nr:tetraacyldisaccharide 4'-kinase [Chitinophagaceae bacterium]